MRFSRRGLVLLLPAILLMAVFVLSVALLGLRSLQGPGGLGLGVYAGIFARPDYVDTLGRTVWLALLTTLCSIVVGYPLAHCIARAKRFQALLTVLVILPWMVSVVVRTYGWVVILGNRGTLNSLLMWLGITDAPVRMLFNQVGIVVGLVHVFCPFMILSILAVMQQLPRSLEEAAMSLGAGPIGTFLRVTLPLTAPGLISGSAIVFLLSTGAVVTPLLLGGPRDPMLAMQVYQDVFNLFNFPRAGALAFVLMGMALLATLPLQWVERRLRRRLPSAEAR
jgi:putative spermidine/putrescine transport system permease protein